jgi:hypothetical protein
MDYFWSGRTYNVLMVRFSVTLGEEPEIELLCVMVPKTTENWLRFSATLHDVASEVRFERVAR